MKKSKLALIAGAIAAGFTGGTGDVLAGTHREPSRLSRRERRTVKGKAAFHCKSKYKPHQGVQEKARRMRQMGITEFKQAA